MKSSNKTIKPYLFNKKKVNITYLFVALFLIIGGVLIFENTISFVSYAETKSINDFENQSKPSDDNGVLFEYYQNENGSWNVGGHNYKYRLELNGKMPNAAVETTFIVLSNDDNLTFDEAYKSILSSQSKDQLSTKRAFMVEMKNQ